MARDVRQIRIDSILGGQSPTTHFGSSDQFRASLGIDPSFPIKDVGDFGTASKFAGVASGLIRPVASNDIGSSVLTGVPMWIISPPKNSNVGTSLIYVYDDGGSIYTVSASGNPTVAISDAGEMTGGEGNGAAYYDNYVYFAKNTTIARYGPLIKNSTATLNGDYWVGTLGKAQLTDSSYPRNNFGSPAISYPNHVMHRHSDGKLYIADVVDNQGTLHYIQTTKTTVEGDTDDGSTYDALNFGYGLYPTAMETYGEYLVISLFEADNPVNNYHGPRAKLAFWDTTSQNINSIIWVEFPDEYISALKNVNGNLYIASGMTVQGS